MNVKSTVQIGLFCALVAVATAAVVIPVAATHGYINFGDGVIFAVAVLFGPAAGGAAGAIGSAMADMFVGAPHWAPFTLVIKGIEGLICGLIAHKCFTKDRRFSTRVAAAMAISAIWMALGYYIAAGILYSFPVALIDVPANLVQGVSGVVVGGAAVAILKRVRF